MDVMSKVYKRWSKHPFAFALAENYEHQPVRWSQYLKRNNVTVERVFLRGLGEHRYRYCSGVEVLETPRER